MSAETQMVIRGYHCDAYGHVNNARYLELFEEARWQLLETNGFLHLMGNYQWQIFLVHIDVKFKHPVVVGAKIKIFTSVHEFSRRTITLEQQMLDGDNKLCCLALVKAVIYDPEKKESVPITEEIQQIFR